MPKIIIFMGCMHHPQMLGSCFLGLPHYDDFWMYASTEHLTKLFMWSQKCRTVFDAQERKGPFLFGSPNDFSEALYRY